MIEQNHIVKNLIDLEPVRITKVQKLGPMTSIDFIGVNTSKSGNKVITDADLDKLEIVTISENEWNRLAQLGENAWLYIVINCKSTPELFRICNPAKNLQCEMKSKGVQYFVPEKEWKAKI